MNARYIGYGALFGFLLSRVGATSYDTISGMFRLSDLSLMGVIGLAVAMNAIGFAVFQRQKARTPAGERIQIVPKPMSRGILWGGVLFGAGWGLSGTCPGTALAQLGEGRLAALVTLAGILAGTQLQRRWHQAGL